MGRKVIFRMDDICPDMNYEKFARARDMFIRYHVRPLLGVIPDNKDLKLKEERQKGGFVQDEKIWQEIRRLKREQSWSIALHGFEHRYLTEESGILNINKKSEFAGVPKELQKEKILRGKKRLSDLGLEPVAFMAPSHSFDRNTLEALRECGIKAVTYGRGIYPYVHEGVVFMPVPYSLFWHFPAGMYTICLHTNTMSEKDFVKLSGFLEKHSPDCMAFEEAFLIVRGQKQRPWASAANGCADAYMKAVLKAASIVSVCKRRR